MQKSPLQNLSLAFCLIVSAAFLFWFIPSQLPQASAPVAQKEDQAHDALMPFIPPPVTAGAIKIKGSGDDADTVQTGTEVYNAAKNEFERRFGSDFEDLARNDSTIHADFSIPPVLQPAVSFWIQVFSKYGKNQYVFHHRDDVGIVYSALDLSDLDPERSGISDNETEKLRNQYIAEEKARIRQLLRAIPAKMAERSPLNAEENRLVKAFAQNPTLSITDAADNETIRVQGGFAHRFRQAISLSGKYMDEIEKIFTAKGLPIELTRLPLIESAFNVRAFSTADAAGIWQFIPDTGAKYLKIDDIADERYDPILSTYAAAQHLANEYDLLKSWPLTINAYNTGPGRMLKAIRQLGTEDIATIIRYFKEPGYQFFSRNYYLEFLAAVHVYENQEKYFGVIEKEPPLHYDIFMPQEEINLIDLAKNVNVDDEVIAKLNPGLSENVLNGSRNLPAGYLVRVPQDMGKIFANAATENTKTDAEARLFLAQEGDTLDSVAKTLKIPVEALEKENNFYRTQKIQAGTMVKLPSDDDVAMKQADDTKVVIP